MIHCLTRKSINGKAIRPLGPRAAHPVGSCRPAVGGGASVQMGRRRNSASLSACTSFMAPIVSFGDRPSWPRDSHASGEYRPNRTGLPCDVSLPMRYVKGAAAPSGESTPEYRISEVIHEAPSQWRCGLLQRPGCRDRAGPYAGWDTHVRHVIGPTMPSTSMA